MFKFWGVGRWMTLFSFAFLFVFSGFSTWNVSYLYNQEIIEVKINMFQKVVINCVREGMRRSGLPYHCWTLHLLLLEFSMKDSQRAFQLLESPTHSKILPDIELNSTFHPSVGPNLSQGMLKNKQNPFLLPQIQTFRYLATATMSPQIFPLLGFHSSLFSNRWFPDIITIMATGLRSFSSLSISFKCGTQK